MKKSKFSEDQIAFPLREAELGTAVDEVCRKMGISEASFICGARIIRTWVRRNCGGSDSWKKRIAS